MAKAIPSSRPIDRGVSGKVIGGFLAILAVVAAFYTLWRLAPHGSAPAPTDAATVSWLFAAYGLLLLYGISIAISGSYNPTAMAIGADGLLSVSKFQFMLWNAAALFGYLWLMAARCYQQHLPYVPIDIPANVLLVTGFSVTTLAAAKAITVAYMNAGRISKPDNVPSSSIKYLGTGDDGTTPDLVKIQMLVWTVVAVVVFLVQTSSSVHAASGDNKLPDIGQALMVLMGLGQAAYLGNKLTATDVPTLSSVQPPVQSAGQPVVVTGTNLYGNLTAYLDSVPVAAVTVPATASSFTMTLPLALPDPSSTLTTAAMVTVPSGHTAQLSVSVDSIASANALPILFK